ncbi:DUF2975 domain-containing protein [Paraglaciecola sp. L3A3]|uniref:DUF2975 domain-containing protein n=1 Tax=Paraglaciecola sp. L3A3 TaxID=2686358 RepID=UPI00131B9FA9|nr:DUF2975 domain-containing protein [Paraglaciecola sp. L3A3]
MSSHNQQALYQKISKVCGVCIPVIYFLIALMIFAVFAIPTLIFFTDGMFTLNGSNEIDLASISSVTKVILAISSFILIGIGFRILWLILNIVQRFKQQEIFSQKNANLANSVAFLMLMAFIGEFILNIYLTVITGNLKLSIPENLATLVFVYVSAWILSIGSQLKAENDLTV